MPLRRAQASQSRALLTRWTCTIRLISAEDIGRTMAESWLRFPAPITTDSGCSE
jgi:hypothetical protein